MKRGFTIIEVVVAIGILGIGVLALAGFFALSSQTTRSARHITTATNLAQGVIDDVMTQSYDELTVGNGAKTRFSEEQNNPLYIYQKQINVSLIDANLASSASDVGLKKIEVFVFWNALGAEKNIQIATVVSRK